MPRCRLNRRKHRLQVSATGGLGMSLVNHYQWNSKSFNLSCSTDVCLFCYLAMHELQFCAICFSIKEPILFNPISRSVAFVTAALSNNLTSFPKHWEHFESNFSALLVLSNIPEYSFKFSH